MPYTKTVKDKVEKFLRTYKSLRDNDQKLIGNYWAKEYSTKLGRPLADTEKDLFKFIARGGLTKPESIRRARQKLQEEHEELRGEVYVNRQTESVDAALEILGYK